MKAKYEKPKQERNVIITMTESEAKKLRDFLGSQTKNSIDYEVYVLLEEILQEN